MVIYKRASERFELQEILEIQKRNRPTAINSHEILNEGFVTVEHEIETLEKMNTVCPHMLAKIKDKVIGYALCIHPQFESEIDLLEPMFTQIKSVRPDVTSFMVMGQICIDKPYRRQGVFRGLYEFYKSQLADKYDCLITEVASSNIRSLNAHKSIGFKTIKMYRADTISWELMQWEWRKD